MPGKAKARRGSLCTPFHHPRLQNEIQSIAVLPRHSTPGGRGNGGKMRGGQRGPEVVRDDEIHEGEQGRHVRLRRRWTVNKDGRWGMCGRGSGGATGGGCRWHPGGCAPEAIRWHSIQITVFSHCHRRRLHWYNKNANALNSQENSDIMINGAFYNLWQSSTEVRGVAEDVRNQQCYSGG